jgi:hypothetical protein
MIKKISIFLFIAILFFSCGKKGDPIYNKENQNSEIFSTQQSTLS